MKLAEALQERADLDRRIRQLQQRLANNAIVQEGESPAEDPQELLAELDYSMTSLEQLIARINLTNCRTMLEDKSLTECLARRDVLKWKLSAYREMANIASQVGHRATRTEIKLFSTVHVKDLQKQADEMAKELRLLDNTIQAANWATDLG